MKQSKGHTCLEGQFSTMLSSEVSCKNFKSQSDMMGFTIKEIQIRQNWIGMGRGWREICKGKFKQGIKFCMSSGKD